MNKVILIGYIQDENLTVRTTAAGDSVLNFTIRVKKNKETNEYFDCTAWKARAEFISKYFKKNDPIIVLGTMATNTYEKDGVKHKKYYVEVSDVEFCPFQRNERVESSPELNLATPVVDDEDSPW